MRAAPIVRLAVAACLGFGAAGLGGLALQALALAFSLGLVARLGVARAGLALAFAFGSLCAPATRGGPRGGPRRAPGLYRFEARVARAPRTDPSGGVEALAELAGRELWLSCAEPSVLARASAGRRVAGLGWYEPPARGGRAKLATMRVAAFSLDLAPAPPAAASLRLAALRAAESALARSLSPRSAGFLGRILLGRGEQMTAADLRHHRRLGLAHLLAVSGLHAVFVAGLCTACLRGLAGRRRRLLAPVALLLGAYAWLCGFRPPVSRAVVGYLCWLAARERGVALRLPAALALGAALTLVCFPADLGSLSFCLSYLAVAGLAWIGPLLPGRRSRLATLWRASLAAQCATATLCFETFGFVSPWAAVLTPLALPVVLALLLAGLVLLGTLALLPALATALAPRVDALCLGYLDACAWGAACAPGLLRPLAAPPEGLAILVLALGLGLAALRASRRLFLSACLASCLCFFLPWRRETTDALTLCAVGHGQALLVVEAGRSLAVDCGDSIGGGLAARKLARALRDTGSYRLDDLVVTHGDADHSSGVAELCLGVGVGRAWLPEAPKVAPLARWLASRGVELRILPPGSEARVGPRARVLLPHPEADRAGSNDGGLCVLYRFRAGPRVLVAGDHEAAGIHALLARAQLAGLRRSDLCVLPHHAALTPALASLVARLRPALCLASTSSRRRLSGEHGRGRLAGYYPWSTGELGDLRIERGADGRFRIRAAGGAPAISTRD